MRLTLDFSFEHNSPFLICSWFDLGHNSIPNYTIFSCLAGAQFADCITCLTTQNFVSVSTQHCIFAISHVWVCTCLNMLRSNVSFICHYSISVCTQILGRAIHQCIFSCLASAQVADCITCLATYSFFFQFEQNCFFASSLFLYIFYIYFWVWTCLNMFRFYVLSICLFSIPVWSHRLSKAIHQHIFSHLAGTLFADCITCLANTNFVLVCTDYHIFASLIILLNFWVWICPNVFHSHVWFICNLSMPVFP